MRYQIFKAIAPQIQSINNYLCHHIWFALQASNPCPELSKGSLKVFSLYNREDQIKNA